MKELTAQPIGIFSFPASNILLPPTEQDHSDALSSLLQGDLDVELPEEWLFLKFAAQGDIEQATRMVAVRDDEISAYNRFVLSPTREAFELLTDRLDGTLKELLGVAAFATGVVDKIPDSFSLEGRLRDRRSE